MIVDRSRQRRKLARTKLQFPPKKNGRKNCSNIIKSAADRQILLTVIVTCICYGFMEAVEMSKFTSGKIP